MENKAHAFVAGAFVIGLIGLIVALVLWFTRDTAVRNAYPHPIRVLFEPDKLRGNRDPTGRARSARPDSL